MANQVAKINLKLASVDYVENFLTRVEANDLFRFCHGFPFIEHIIRIYGKEVVQPRRTCFFGSKSYKYSGSVIDGNPMPKELEVVIDKIMTFLPPDHPRLNIVLCNFYQDGNNYISPHSDTETDLIHGSCIAGVSLGAVRHFDIISKAGDEPKHRVDLAHGSLIIMKAGCQTHYKHGIPVQKNVNSPRISLTFRAMK